MHSYRKIPEIFQHFVFHQRYLLVEIFLGPFICIFNVICTFRVHRDDEMLFYEIFRRRLFLTKESLQKFRGRKLTIISDFKTDFTTN